MANQKINKKTNALIIIIIIPVLIFAGFVSFLLLGKDKALHLDTGKAPLPAVEDGIYIGSYQGFRWSNTVEVTVKFNKITALRVLKPQVFAKEETFDELASRIIMSQSTDVDAVSGATADSKAYLKAIENALNHPENR